MGLRIALSPRRDQGIFKKKHDREQDETLRTWIPSINRPGNRADQRERREANSQELSEQARESSDRAGLNHGAIRFQRNGYARRSREVAAGGQKLIRR